MIAAGSFQATRTTGTVSVCEIACSIGATSLISAVPCWRSTHRASKPCRAMTSAVNPWDTESQPSVTHFFARHISLILFCSHGRTSRLPFNPVNGRIGHERTAYFNTGDAVTRGSTIDRAKRQNVPMASPDLRFPAAAADFGWRAFGV